MRTHRGNGPPDSAAAGRPEGFSLVEVLVALAIMALVSLALFALQATGLRAARSVGATRQQAADLRYEAGMITATAGATTGSAEGCRATYVTGSCTVTSTCLVEVEGETVCALLLATVTIADDRGRSVAETTVSYAPLEAAPVGQPAPGGPPSEAPPRTADPRLVPRSPAQAAAQG